jgi:hypothetical protein
MDEKYKEYFIKQTVDKWSLIDYDRWLIKNFDHKQPAKSHRRFYTILTDMLVNDDYSEKTTKVKFLLKNKKVSVPSCNKLLANNGMGYFFDSWLMSFFFLPHRWRLVRFLNRIKLAKSGWHNWFVWEYFSLPDVLFFSSLSDFALVRFLNRT